MQSLGSHLRELRQRRGVSLEEMARITRVTLRYLEALEADDHGALPATVFTRGFIRAYCQALREPPDEALALCPGAESTRAAASHAPPDGRLAPAVAEREAANRGTVLVSFVLLVVFGLGLFGLTLVLQSGREDGADRRAAAPSVATPTEVLSPPPPAARTSGGVSAPGTGAAVAPRPVDGVPAPGGATAAAPAATTATSAAAAPGPQAEIARRVASVTSPYRLVARTSEATWVRVRMGDGRVVEETIVANEVREWVSNQPFVLTIGNAGGISLELNGHALPSLGSPGAVISRLVIPPPSDAGPPPAKPAPGQ